MANFAEGPRSLDSPMAAASAQVDAEVQDHVRRPHALASLLVYSTSRFIGWLLLITPATPQETRSGEAGVTVLQVPVVDLSQSDDDVLSTLKRACTTTGFFYGAQMAPAMACSCTMHCRRSSSQHLVPVIEVLIPSRTSGAGHCCRASRHSCRAPTQAGKLVMPSAVGVRSSSPVAQ